MRVASDYLRFKVSCCLISRFLFVRSLQVHLRTRRDGACGLRSSCQTWRTNKHPTVRLAGERVQHSYYYTHTHTPAHTHTIMKDVHGCPLVMTVWTPAVRLTLVISLFTHGCAHRDTNRNKFPFHKESLMSSGCPQFCSPTTDNKRLCASRDLGFFFVVLNVSKDFFFFF